MTSKLYLTTVVDRLLMTALSNNCHWPLVCN